MWKSIITNWTTSVPALLITVCASTELFNLLPPEWSKYLIAFCGFMTAIGFFAAKSANVSHSGTNADPHIVPFKTSGLTVLPWLLPLFLLGGCAGLTFPTDKNQLESLIAVTASGTYTVNVTVTKDGLVFLNKTETWQCTSDGEKLTGCHRQTVQP